MSNPLTPGNSGWMPDFEDPEMPPAKEKAEARRSAAACSASSIPAMHITTTPGVPPLHELKGWDELNRWGMLNHPHWHAIQRRVAWADGMSEIDKLRLLAGEMLRLNVELAERNLELIRVMPVSPIFIPSQNVKSDGTAGDGTTEHGK